jgi:hypothetical protein
VPRPDFPKTIVEFQRRFADETACRDYLFACRWPDGFRCPACGFEHAYQLPRRFLWQCSRCHHQVSITAGTVLHKTRTPIHLWFWAAYLTSTGTPGISALQLQRQLGLKRYETAWMMLHKLRRAMVAPEMVRQLASRCPSVLVEETTEAIDPDDLGRIRFAPHLRRPNWRPLAETLVWTNRVIVVD